MAYSEKFEFKQFNAIGSQVDIVFGNELGSMLKWTDFDGDGELDAIYTGVSFGSIESTKYETYKDMSKVSDVKDFEIHNSLFHDHMKNAVTKALETAKRAVATKMSKVLSEDDVADLSSWVAPKARRIVAGKRLDQLMILEEDGDSKLERIQLATVKDDGELLYEFTIDRSFLVNYSIAVSLGHFEDDISKILETIPEWKNYPPQTTKKKINKIAISHLLNQVKSEEAILNEFKISNLDGAWLYVEDDKGGHSLIDYGSRRTGVNVFSNPDFVPDQINDNTKTVIDYKTVSGAPKMMQALKDYLPTPDHLTSAIHTAAMLNKRGYKGKYEMRLITGNGILIVQPNRELLKKNPTEFYSAFHSVNYDCAAIANKVYSEPFDNPHEMFDASFKTNRIINEFAKKYSNSAMKFNFVSNDSKK